MKKCLTALLALACCLCLAACQSKQEEAPISVPVSYTHLDVHKRQVFVLTPKREVLALAKGATPLDFAYRGHTQVGHKCVGAKVNGRIVPLNTELQSGDFVEVMTSASSRGPSRDWLNIVKTSEARSKIRS